MNHTDHKFFAVIESLPWLTEPRIVGVFNSLDEADKEASKLNSKSLDSSFAVGELHISYSFGPMPFVQPLRF